jgi:hypothetical protein
MFGQAADRQSSSAAIQPALHNMATSNKFGLHGIRRSMSPMPLGRM